MNPTKFVLITGANRGIGLQIAKVVRFKYNFNILLCARSEEAGREAIKEIEAELPSYSSKLNLGLVDINNKDSVNSFVKTFEDSGSKIDILVNNAGILYRAGDAPDPDTCSKTMNVNFFGTIDFTSKMYRFLNLNAKVIFIGSILGPRAFDECSEDLKKRFLDDKATVDEVCQFAGEYLSCVKSGTWKGSGFALWDYGVSKLFLQVAVKAMSREKDAIAKNLQFYCIHPGVITTGINNFSRSANHKDIKESTRSFEMMIEKPWGINEKENGGFYHEDGSFYDLDPKMRVL